jgi:hypothetical protein
MPSLVGRYCTTLERLRDKGASTAEIETLVARAPVPEEGKAALWLYAHAIGCPLRPESNEPPRGRRLVAHR